MTQIKRITAGALKALIRAYQLLVSPVLANNCRFHPSCSCYALEALEVHGPVAGSWLAIKRILRCHPWGGAGLDPVPNAAPEAADSLNNFHKC